LSNSILDTKNSSPSPLQKKKGEKEEEKEGRRIDFCEIIHKK
jgi:hypothetical protein